MGAVGTKVTVEYLRNRSQEEVVDDSRRDATAAAAAEVSYANEKDKNQMLALIYTSAGRAMSASVGYTPQATDYSLKLASTPFAIEVNDKQFQSSKGETAGANEVDFVLASS